jgi:two-component system KDP operon response regulator KdpE
MALNRSGWNKEGMHAEPPRHAARTGARILVVESETPLARAIRDRLSQNDFSVEVATGTSGARAAYPRFRPDLIVLDVDHGRAAAWDFIRETRSRTCVPILVLSADGVERDKVATLELGADDYITKPIGLEELLARVRVALRHVARPERGAEPVIRVGDLQVDLERRRVLRAGHPVHLTPTEYDLLKLFTAYPDKVLTDRMLLDEIWGRAKRPREHTLHVYMARLRQKLEITPEAPRYLLTEPGAGYRLATEPDGAPGG